MWQRLRNVFRRREADDAFFAELEATLLAGDVGPELTREWLGAARTWKRAEDVQRVLRERMLTILFEVRGSGFDVGTSNIEHRTTVIMIVGVNGVGKTTTIAKLAHRFRRDGQRPLLVAADTFRAAAIDQLRIWADRIGVPCIAKAPGADAAAVAFDGVAAGVARKAHVVLIDTSGRLHTKTPLMEELKKVKRVMGKALADAPHEIWCVLDATTGQNAIAQVREFHAALGLTGLVVAKYDGTAKAGALFAVARAASLPIRFLGTGEQVTDLAAFAPERFVDRLLA